MAIYHFSASVISRGKGQRSIASAAYRSASIMYDRKHGKFENYTKKSDVAYSRILTPEDAPNWLKEIALLSESGKHALASEKLWNLVEFTEKRKDSQLARDIEISLPKELTLNQNVELIEKFSHLAFTSRGMVVDLNVHWKEGNPHIHFMLSTRCVEQHGFGQKAREWNDKALFVSLRELWAETCNYALAKYGHDKTIDHRSNEDRGIGLEPTEHEGIATHSYEGKKDDNSKNDASYDQNNKQQKQNKIGSKSDQNKKLKITPTRSKSTDILISVKKRNEKVRERNRQRIQETPEILIEKVAKQKSSFNEIDLANELAKQMLNHKDYSPQIIEAVLDKIYEHANAVNSDKENNLSYLFQQPPTDDKTITQIQSKKITNAQVRDILEEISTQKSAFTEKDIAKAVNLMTEGTAEFTELLLKVKSSPELMAIGPGEDGRERYATKAAFKIENAIQNAVDILKTHNTHAISGKVVEKFCKKHNLSEPQKISIRHILEGSDISAIVGFAGTGKSYMMQAARKAWESKGYNVQGIALAGVASDGLSKSSGIKSRTIKSFLLAIENGNLKLSKNDVIVMDEAGMVDNSSMAEVINAVQSVGAKLTLIGDPEQLHAIGPGAPFRAIIERIGFAELDEVRRQVDAWQKQATIQFAKLKTFEALTSYEKHGCIHLFKDQNGAKTQLISDWTGKFKQGDPLSELLILAHRNNDVAALNLMAREQLLQSGYLKDKLNLHTNNGAREFAIGERILFLKNSYDLGVKNGQRGTLVNFNKHQLIIRMDGNEECEVVIPYRDYKDMDYSYATTVHKAQGMTVDHSFVYSAGYWVKNLTYVALSRHRLSVNCYGDKETYKDTKELKKGMSRWGIKDSILDYPLAFAIRRGIEAQNIAKRLQQHILNKVNNMADSVSQAFEQTFIPGQYWEKQKELSIHKQEEQETLKRRIDAKLVAEYVDLRINVGKYWEKVYRIQSRLEKSGQSKDEIRAYLNEHKDGIQYKDYRDYRDAIANSLCKEIGLYGRAIELNNIERGNLWQQSDAHERRRKVQKYLEAKNTIFRDKVAANLYNEIKANYPHLKEHAVNTNKLRDQAMAHERRVVLSGLTTKERNNFKKVETYIDLTRETAKAWQSLDKGDVELMQQRVYDLLLNRNELAYTLLHNKENYQVSLDFHNIKAIGKDFVGPITRQDGWGQGKYENLVAQAIKFEPHKRFLDYVKAKEIGNYETQSQLAFEIVQNPKQHHPAVVRSQEQNPGAIKQLWQEIREKAYSYEKDKLSPEELIKEFEMNRNNFKKLPIIDASAEDSQKSTMYYNAMGMLADKIEQNETAMEIARQKGLKEHITRNAKIYREIQEEKRDMLNTTSNRIIRNADDEYQVKKKDHIKPQSEQDKPKPLNPVEEYNKIFKSYLSLPVIDRKKEEDNLRDDYVKQLGTLACTISKDPSLMNEAKQKNISRQVSQHTSRHEYKLKQAQQKEKGIYVEEEDIGISW
jgi:Ti-type conjugative transfer relaxase TraA